MLFPSGGSAAGFTQNPLTEWDNYPRFLSDRNKNLRWYLATFRMVPTNQCFIAGTTTICCREQWLIGNTDLTANHGVAQISLHLAALSYFAVHFRRVECNRT